jgi:hypothetical protein
MLPGEMKNVLKDLINKNCTEFYAHKGAKKDLDHLNLKVLM